MDEADRLCDRLAIIDHGKIVALGTPRELKDGLPGQDTLDVAFVREVDDALIDALKGVPEVKQVTRGDEEHTVHLVLAGETVPIEAVTEVAHRLGHRLKNLSLVEPTLEDVFIHYTGRGLRDAAAGEYRYAMPSMMR
jgi:ABC-2 type transport system ATP-binding protein